MEVHKTLGSGFLEAVYEKALMVEFEAKGLRFQSQVSFPVIYKGVKVKDYCCDLVVNDLVLVELKAVTKLTDIDRAQSINYLKVTGMELALLNNFRRTSLEHERLVVSQRRPS